MIWAMFGIWFIIGPVIWAIFSWHSLQFLWWISAWILFVNALIIWILIPESKKCIECAEKDESISPVDFHHNKKQLQILFITSFWVALWFSANQSILPLYLNDKFNITESKMWYVFWLIWTISVLYQLFWIKHTRRIFKEKWLVVFWLIVMTIVFILFWINNIIYLTFILVTLFPVAYWSINPWVNSLIAWYALNETGKAMWTNVSYISIANIVGPLIAWYAYSFWTWFPYFIACWFFIITLCLFYKNIK